MYRKKHILIASCAAALAGILLTSACFIYFWGVGGGILSRARGLIIDNYVDPLTDEQIDNMEDAAISAMVASLQDPYSGYLNSESFAEFQEDAKEEYVGIGITVSLNTQTNEMTIVETEEGSSAQEAGLQPQDVILAADDIQVSTETYSEVLEHIRGEGAKEGEIVTLTIRRGDEEPFTVDVPRKVVNVQTISYQMLEEKIGYLRISEFKSNTVQDFEDALEALKAEGMLALIIDLRNDPGGYAQSVLDMTDMLLPEGVIAYLEDNKGQREYFYSDEEALGLPMAVLINGSTASAAELMAGSLQAYEVATIVGEKSYGKAVGQRPIMLTPNSAIYLTHARYYTPKGECIDQKGIEPDIEVVLEPEQTEKLFQYNPDNTPQLSRAEDTQLLAALDTLKEVLGQ